MFPLRSSGPPSAEGVVHDEKRLRILRNYDIPDTDPEPAFDRIARLAEHLFDAPMALVNFVDADRQWFKSSIGVEEEETRLDGSFCVYTIEKGDVFVDVFVVENLAENERFEDNPYVTEHGVRFYAGAPFSPRTVTVSEPSVCSIRSLNPRPRRRPTASPT